MSKDGRALPSVERIARFWANRCLLHDTPLIWATAGYHRQWTQVTDIDGTYEDGRSDYWERSRILEGGCPCMLEARRFTSTFCDPGEPDCMSCGRFLGYTRNAGFWVGPSSFTGERCHVIPRSLDGPDKVWNLVLLCHSCHALNPEQSSRRYYLDWLIARNRQAVEAMGLVTERMAIRYPGRLSDEKLGELAPVIFAMWAEYMIAQPRYLGQFSGIS